MNHNVYFKRWIGLLFLMVLSAFSTFASFYKIPEGNKSRALVLFFFSLVALLKVLNKKHWERILYDLKHSVLFKFFVFTSILSFFHILIEGRSVSVNSLDFFFPCFLLIYVIFMSNAKNINKIITLVLGFWLVVGIPELFLNLLMDGAKFCGQYCSIYYANRPGAAATIQTFFLTNFISLESLGLSSQEFSIVLGLILVKLFCKLRSKISLRNLLLLLLLLLIQVFSISASVLFAEIIAAVYVFKERKVHFDFMRFFWGFSFAILLIYLLKFGIVKDFNRYLDLIIYAPYKYFLEMSWYEKLFGVTDSGSLPMNNRYFILLGRFGILWGLCFVWGMFKLINQIKKRQQSSRALELKSCLLFLSLCNVHNNLWSTISGSILLSLIIINLYHYFYGPLKYGHV